MLIRTEELRDRDAVSHVVMDAFEADGEHVAELVDALRPLVTPASGLSLVAEEDGFVVGHVMFTSSLLDAPRELVEVQVLSPLAVLPDRQRHGVGSRLVREGLRVLDERRVPVVFLEGSPSYYPRLGFVPGGECGFRKPSLRIPDKAFQAMRLGAYEPWMTGTLVYSDVFWRFDAVGLRNDDGATSQ